MSLNYNVDEDGESEGERKLPNVEHDISRAKMFLQQHSPESGDSLYEHISELLEKILAERPRNAVDVFETYSKKLKDERYRSKTNYLREYYVPAVPSEEAKKFVKLYQEVHGNKESDDVTEDDDGNDDPKRISPDLLELFFYLEQIDVALPRPEIVALNFSIRKLIADKPIRNVRFWGKIIGRPKNYYVVEAQLLDEELAARRSSTTKSAETIEETRNEVETEETLNPNEETKEQRETRTNDEIARAEEGSEKLQLVFPPMPKKLWKEPAIVPTEEIGTGLNKNIYYVCTSPGLDDWIELPSVTPQQIVSTRRIVRAFTGDLENPLYTFPPFPGTEKNYLRAQIARITASTLVSPVGFFIFGESLDEEVEEEEEDTEIPGEEDETDTGMISENRRFEPLSLKELIDPSMSNWCHHSSYILQQGRTLWWDPRQAESSRNEDETDVEEEEEEEEEEKEEEEEEKWEENEDEEEEDRDIGIGEFQKQVGPPLLTPLSEDSALGTIGAWTARASSTIKSNLTAIAIVRSNIWPGSFAFATGKKFANVYIGMGQKFNPYNYSPPDMPIIQEQYSIGPEVMEIQDPSFEAEEAYRIAHLPLTKLGPLEFDGEGEEEDVDQEDDEDDEDDDD